MKNGVTGRKNNENPQHTTPQYHPDLTPNTTHIASASEKTKKQCARVRARVRCLVLALGFPYPQYFGRVRLYSAGGSLDYLSPKTGGNAVQFFPGRFSVRFYEW